MIESIVPIVEGISEVVAVPVLMRRLTNQWGKFNLQIGKPVRVRRSKVVRGGELERRVMMAMSRSNCRAVVVILDADDDCPKEVAAALLKRAQQVAGNILVSVILPKSELESWFVSSIESLRGVCGISAQATSPNNPENIRDAKGFLSNSMESGRSYSAVADQPSLIARFDYEEALNRCRSFRKFHSDFYKIVTTLSP